MEGTNHYYSLPDNAYNHMHPLYMNDGALDEDIQIVWWSKGAIPTPLPGAVLLLQEPWPQFCGQVFTLILEYQVMWF